eukprot:CAMPEP_0172643220 /NCGR_PEP_ID=MMETSP1068-20121228/235934_1 /TAXON_ID=35684 /ORGANISM="Pseudopedinella elastica, Strain CCMP716" /LENGTH=66 /DNA_ID=CAMNT_0013457223 /DNA_START=273 /DNA_END=473 /DNA_ORIENTATION=+
MVYSATRLGNLDDSRDKILVESLYRDIVALPPKAENKVSTALNIVSLRLGPRTVVHETFVHCRREV